MLCRIGSSVLWDRCDSTRTRCPRRWGHSPSRRKVQNGVGCPGWKMFTWKWRLKKSKWWEMKMKLLKKRPYNQVKSRIFYLWSTYFTSWSKLSVWITSMLLWWEDLYLEVKNSLFVQKQTAVITIVTWQEWERWGRKQYIQYCWRNGWSQQVSWPWME